MTGKFEKLAAVMAHRRKIGFILDQLVVTNDLIQIKRISKGGRVTLSWPDPLANDFFETFIGKINVGLEAGSLDVDEAQRQINAFLAEIQGVDSIESPPVTRAEFNVEDPIKARGMSNRLDD